MLREEELERRLARVRLVAFDFDGVFTDNKVYVTQDGHESVRCTRADGIGLGQLRAVGVESIVLSTEPNPVVSARCRKLGIPCEQGLDDKLEALRKVLEQRGLTPEDAAYVGNDVNDLDCLRAVGLPIVVADAHPDVMDAAAWRTRTPGGEGAVREVCDRIVAARQ